jgi:glycosyltransferase involved in cell wall biosynthesis
VYLLPITVPIFKDGARLRIATDWKRALVLLRDSLEGRYGVLGVAAPWRPVESSEHVLEEATPAHDGIELIPTFDARERLRSYWMGPHQQALQTVRDRLAGVQVVHGTAEEPLRPFCYQAFMAGVAQGKPSVFVQDQDVVDVVRKLHADDGWKGRAAAEVHARLQEHQCRRAITAAGLSLLKGRTTLERYRACSPHIHAVEDTSYFSHEIVASDIVTQRVASLLQRQGTRYARPLRFVFCGRLLDIKGVDRSIRIVHAARQRGANVTLDIVGSGPEHDALQQLITTLRLSDVVTMVGALPYGAALLQRLAQNDALLFNPRMEETPRMIFDGYAAGLPLVAGGIDYVQERAQADAAALVLPRDDDAQAVKMIVALDADREPLRVLTGQALKAAHHHAADRWYQRRAQWTHEMVARHHAAKT